MKLSLKAQLLGFRCDVGPSAENDRSCAGAADSDERLMEAIARGNAASFAVVVERHTPALYRVCYRMLRDGSESEDVVQECFTRLWLTAPGWKAKGAGLIAWLHRVAMNLCLDRLRKPAVIVTDTFPDLRDEGRLPDQWIESEETRHVIEEALAILPNHYRAALVLSYYEGFPNAVAAEVLDMNVKAFESLLGRARRHLRKLLEARELTVSDIEALA